MKESDKSLSKIGATAPRRRSTVPSVPAMLAPLLGLSLGALFALFGSDELARTHGPPTATRAAAVVTLFGLLVFGPFAGYFVVQATDWSLAYLVDARQVPSALLLLLVLLDVATVPLGFVAASRAARGRQAIAVLPLVLVPLALGVVGAALLASRLSVLGSAVEVRRGLPRGAFAGSSLAQATRWLWICLAAGVVWTAIDLRRRE